MERRLQQAVRLALLPRHPKQVRFTQAADMLGLPEALLIQALHARHLKHKLAASLAAAMTERRLLIQTAQRQSLEPRKASQIIPLVATTGLRPHGQVGAALALQAPRALVAIYAPVVMAQLSDRAALLEPLLRLPKQALSIQVADIHGLPEALLTQAIPAQATKSKLAASLAVGVMEQRLPIQTAQPQSQQRHKA